MRKIFCDVCGTEITESSTVNGTFNNKNGYLVSVKVSVESKQRADICKSCIIEIIQTGKTVGCIEETW